jgi:hypothetical protein
VYHGVWCIKNIEQIILNLKQCHSHKYTCWCSIVLALNSIAIVPNGNISRKTLYIIYLLMLGNLLKFKSTRKKIQGGS